MYKTVVCHTGIKISFGFVFAIVVVSVRLGFVALLSWKDKSTFELICHRIWCGHTLAVHGDRYHYLEMDEGQKIHTEAERRRERKRAHYDVESQLIHSIGDMRA